MQIYYALYDHTMPKGGTCWQCFPEVLNKYTLDAFYNNKLASVIPANINELTADNVNGGVVRFDKWTVLYRFYNGGRDSSGRPGRYVIFSAWIPTDETFGKDISPVIYNERFRNIQTDAYKIPIPYSSPLTETVADTDCLQKFTLDEKENEKTFLDLQDSFRFFVNIPLERSAAMFINNDSFRIIIGKKPGPTREEMLEKDVAKYRQIIATEKQKYENAVKDWCQKRTQMEQSLQVMERSLQVYALQCSRHKEECWIWFIYGVAIGAIVGIIGGLILSVFVSPLGQ